GAALGQVIDLAALVTLDPPRAAGAPRSRGRQAALQPGTAVAVAECPLPLAGDEGVGVAHQTADAPVTLPLPGAGWKLPVPGHQQALLGVGHAQVVVVVHVEPDPEIGRASCRGRGAI